MPTQLKTRANAKAQRPYTKIVSALVTSLAAISLSVAAQINGDQEETAEADRWYQVEVILVAHKNSVDKEIWRSDIALAYPPNWIELKDPDDFRESSSECTENGDDTLAEDNTSAPASEVDCVESSEQEKQLPQVADLEREAYYLLPKSLRALNDQTQEFKWSRRHRVLFHQAWRQPILAKDEATSIIISAGEQYGEHAELEGTLSINVSRYLHLNTNLWFSEFAHNYGQDKGLWPELPTRPSQQQYSLTDAETSSESPWDRVQPLNDEYDKILDTPYIPEQITLIKQKRRMRSKEVHYIDHPKVGIIILIEPYEVPAIEPHPEELPQESAAQIEPLDTAEPQTIRKTAFSTLG